MDQASQLSNDGIQLVVMAALTSIQPDLKNANPDSCLLGNQAVINSVGFVNLLVTLEQRLPVQVDLASSFMEQQECDDSENPFMSIGSLVNHIHHLAQQKS